MNSIRNFESSIRNFLMALLFETGYFLFKSAHSN